MIALVRGLFGALLFCTLFFFVPVGEAKAQSCGTAANIASSKAYQITSCIRRFKEKRPADPAIARDAPCEAVYQLFLRDQALVNTAPQRRDDNFCRQLIVAQQRVYGEEPFWSGCRGMNRWTTDGIRQCILGAMRASAKSKLPSEITSCSDALDLHALGSGFSSIARGPTSPGAAHCERIMVIISELRQLEQNPCYMTARNNIEQQFKQCMAGKISANASCETIQAAFNKAYYQANGGYPAEYHPEFSAPNCEFINRLRPAQVGSSQAVEQSEESTIAINKKTDTKRGSNLLSAYGPLMIIGLFILLLLAIFIAGSATPVNLSRYKDSQLAQLAMSDDLYIAINRLNLERPRGKSFLDETATFFFNFLKLWLYYIISSLVALFTLWLIFSKIPIISFVVVALTTLGYIILIGSFVAVTTSHSFRSQMLRQEINRLASLRHLDKVSILSGSIFMLSTLGSRSYLANFLKGAVAVLFLGVLQLITASIFAQYSALPQFFFWVNAIFIDVVTFGQLPLERLDFLTTDIRELEFWHSVSADDRTSLVASSYLYKLLIVAFVIPQLFVRLKNATTGKTMFHGNIFTLFQNFKGYLLAEKSTRIPASFYRVERVGAFEHENPVFLSEEQLEQELVVMARGIVEESKGGSNFTKISRHATRSFKPSS